MSENFFTEKQKNVIRMLKRDELKRINILYGSVRSGKTWITLLVFALWVAEQPIEDEFLMCAKTVTSLKRNCLNLLQDMVGESNFQYSASNKSAILFNHKIHLEGANDSRAENKIRGMTLKGAYVDEVTLIERDFFVMLLSRLSVRGAKLFGSTNPDSPYHWLKTEYFNRENELDIYIERYSIDDNTFLDPEYVSQIKTEYTGVFYERFIEGYFALAEGLIYPMYEKAFEEPPESKAEAYALSIDYGTMNAFAVTLWGKYGPVWWGIDEYYYSGRDAGATKTDDEYYQDIEKFLDERGIESRLYTVIDPSAASFIALLRKNTKRYNVKKANNDVLKGIELTAVAMQRGIIKFSPKCKNTKKEFGGYVWDESAIEDRPVKVNDHCLTGETLVMTDSGEKPISELVGTVGNVLSYNTTTNQPEIKPYKDCRLTQKKAKIYKIELEDGRYIRCTGEHPVLTERGYKRADELTVNDRIIEVCYDDILHEQ